MMNAQIKDQLDRYPSQVAELFMTLRQLMYGSVSGSLDEKMWARLPSYFVGESFVRLIPFKDHINVEARAIINHREELSGYQITPKGMLQIFVNQPIPTEMLQRIFAETLTEKEQE